jgi:hypothetical protein
VNSTLAACENAELAQELRGELQRRLGDLDSEPPSSPMPPDDLNDGALAAAVAG